MTSKNCDGDWRPEYITAGWPQLVTITGDIVITSILEESWRRGYRATIVKPGKCDLKWEMCGGSGLTTVQSASDYKFGLSFLCFAGSANYSKTYNGGERRKYQLHLFVFPVFHSSTPRGDNIIIGNHSSAPSTHHSSQCYSNKKFKINLFCFLMQTTGDFYWCELKLQSWFFESLLKWPLIFKLFLSFKLTKTIRYLKKYKNCFY